MNKLHTDICREWKLLNHKTSVPHILPFCCQMKEKKNRQENTSTCSARIVSSTSLVNRYINKVTVQDLHTRQVWQFLCGCWLSADRGDGMTKKTFNAAKNNEIASFRSGCDQFFLFVTRCNKKTKNKDKNSRRSRTLTSKRVFLCRNIFQTRTSTGFRDEHIWVSIVDPPSRSPFTRAQRVSCCMSLLLCTMAINIAFWNIPVDQTSPVLFSLGDLSKIVFRNRQKCCTFISTASWSEGDNKNQT